MDTSLTGGREFQIPVLAQNYAPKMNTFTVYAIKSVKNNSIYVGMTQNLERRLAEHNAGKTQSTKPYIPYVLIFTEQCPNRTQARNRELYWKSGIGKEQLKKLPTTQL